MSHRDQRALERLLLGETPASRAADLVTAALIILGASCLMAGAVVLLGELMLTLIGGRS